MAGEKKSRWGLGMAALYGGFVIFILACVGFASLQDFDLVERDYYAQGLAFETKLQKMRRTAQLVIKPLVTYRRPDSTVEVRFPAEWECSKLSGAVTLYYPAEAKYDRQAQFGAEANGVVTISSLGLPAGVWKVKIDWTYDGASYYIEDVLVIG